MENKKATGRSRDILPCLSCSRPVSNASRVSFAGGTSVRRLKLVRTVVLPEVTW